MQKKLIWGAVLFGIGLGLFSSFYFYFPIKEKAHLSEMKTAMAALISSMEAFHNETGRYSDDFDTIGYSPGGELQSKLYLKSKDVPLDILERIAENDRPFVTNSDYQILGILDKSDGSTIFFKVSKKSPKPRQILPDDSD